MLPILSKKFLTEGALILGNKDLEGFGFDWLDNNDAGGEVGKGCISIAPLLAAAELLRGG